MHDCGFPAIPRYLSERRWPQDQLADAKVTHVWAQDADRAHHIAKAALVENVVERPEEMIGAIDGLLLARDDAENHATLAESFLRAGIPVYLDKAPALSVAEFDRVLAMQSRPGLVFTGTALRFASELQLDAQSREQIGRIRHVFGITPNGWDRYAVHVIEPALAIVGDLGVVTQYRSWSAGDTRGLHVRYDSGVQMHFSTLGAVAAPITIEVIGEKGAHRLTFTDAFLCFRAALFEFVSGIIAGGSRTDLAFMHKVVALIEHGRA
jgi:predicted dehydrogenase